MIISSKSNPKYKQLSQLHTAHGRKKYGLFIIEGQRELSRALLAKVPLEYGVFSSSAVEKSDNVTPEVQFWMRHPKTLILSDELFQKISLRESPDGFMGVAKIWNSDPSKITIRPDGLYLLVEKLEKPGNLGALMRSAEATGVDGLFIADPVVDIFNPHVIRTSQGAVFNLNITWDTSENLLKIFEKHALQLLATTPHTNTVYWDCDLSRGCVICVGSEAYGLTDLWMQKAQKVLIPMYGNSADSLNAAVAGTLCLYEARRQRYFRTKAD
jgi:rRNA methylases